MTDTPPAAKPLTARIEVFRPGTFTPMGGKPITFSAADLRAIADAYDPATAPAPIVVGHPGTDAPAFGWAESFEYDSAAERLFANVGQIEPAFAEAVKAGRYKKVSMQYFSPSQAHNPAPGCWYPKHVGFLGGAAPAVPGLKNVQFSGEPGVTFEASFGGADEAASLFRKLRDLLIEKFGIEDADKALPSWQIEWLDDQGNEPEVRGFAEPAAIPEKPTPEEEDPAVTKPADPAFAAREAEIEAREKRIADREAELTHADNAAFAEGLVQGGKLLPASKGKVVALLDALPGHEAVSFSEGTQITPGAALKEILEAQPKIVSFGEAAIPEAPGAGPASFAAGGREVDPDRLEIHNKAVAYQKAHPGTSYDAAVDAVS